MDLINLGDIIRPAKVIRCGQKSYPVLSMTMHDGIVLQKERFKKSLASADTSAYKVVKRGQLVIGFPIDEGVLYVQHITNAGIMSPAYNVWDITNPNIDPDYLELCLHSPHAMQYYKSKLRGTTARRRSIPKKELLKLKICIYPLSEQRRRVQMISKIDELVNLRNKQFSKLGILAKSRFVEMFGDPASSKARYLPKRLTEFGKIITGMTPSKQCQEYYASSDIPFIKPGDIDEGHVTRITTTENFISEKAQDVARIFPKGTIVITCIGIIGKIGIVEETSSCNQQINAITCNENVSNTYLAYCLLLMKDVMNAKANAPVVPILNKTDFSDIKVPSPPFSIQNDFASFIRQLDKSGFAIKQSLKKLETLKKALMQQYFG